MNGDRMKQKGPPAGEIREKNLENEEFNDRIAKALERWKSEGMPEEIPELIAEIDLLLKESPRVAITLVEEMTNRSRYFSNAIEILRL